EDDHWDDSLQAEGGGLLLFLQRCGEFLAAPPELRPGTCEVRDLPGGAKAARVHAALARQEGAREARVPPRRRQRHLGLLPCGNERERLAPGQGELEREGVQRPLAGAEVREGDVHSRAVE